MRVNRLDLIAYGKFTNRSIDFGPKPASGPDLHVVYGPNEAGKSTLFAAMLDLFYGIETRSPYGFLHPYETMRIGADLLVDGGARRFIRIKKQQGLLDGEGRVLSETAMSGALGGVSREDCRTRFSLDAETLKQGGRDILASKGDLGQLLFTASAGLADFSKRLADIERELDAFHAPQKRSGKLVDLKDDAERLKKEREAADVPASAYRALREALSQAESTDRSAEAASLAASKRAAEIAVLAEGLRLAGELKALAAEQDAATRAAEASAPALAHAVRAEALAADASVHRKALEDLPNRRRDAEESEAEVRRLLAELGRADEQHPRRLVLSAAEREALRRLIERRSQLDAGAATAREVAAQAGRTLAEAEAALIAGGADAPSLAAVKTALAQLRADDSATRERLATSRIAKADDDLADQLAALHPWTGDADALAALAAPEQEELAAVRAGIDAAAKAESAAREALDRTTADLARHTAALAALGDGGALADGADHAAVRATREERWASHRKSLDATSADAFETAMRRDDAAAEARLTQAASVAQHAQLRVALASAGAEQAQADLRFTAASAALKTARQRLAAMVAAAAPALSASMSVEAFAGWLRRRETVLALRAERRTAAREAAEAAAEGERVRQALAEALAAVGHGAPEGSTAAALAQAADALIGLEAAARALRETRDRAARAAAEQQQALQAAAEEMAAWTAEWRAALSACWIGQARPDTTPAEAGAILALLVHLEAALNRRAERLDRLEKLERDIHAFEDKAAALARDFGLDEAIGALAAVETIRDRIAAAMHAADQRGRLAEKRQAAEAALLRALNAATPLEAEAALAGADAATLAAERADLALRLPDLERARLDAFSAMVQAQRALDAIGGDAAAARLAARRANLLLEIGDQAERHLARRLGVLAVRQALRSYRDQHRSSMLQAASEAFATMTRGAYAGLAAQAEGGAEKLVAIAREGGSREADELSTGTQYQLYLALRVAGHREFAMERTPLPFVCDDILETFDDLRAEEALKLLAGMAEHGQVICLTHHRHLCAIAREICPSAQLHEL